MRIDRGMFVFVAACVLSGQPNLVRLTLAPPLSAVMLALHSAPLTQIKLNIQAAETVFPQPLAKRPRLCIPLVMAGSHHYF